MKHYSSVRSETRTPHGSPHQLYLLLRIQLLDSPHSSGQSLKQQHRTRFLDAHVVTLRSGKLLLPQGSGEMQVRRAPRPIQGSEVVGRFASDETIRLRLVSALLLRGWVMAVLRNANGKYGGQGLWNSRFLRPGLLGEVETPKLQGEVHRIPARKTSHDPFHILISEKCKVETWLLSTEGNKITPYLKLLLSLLLYSACMHCMHDRYRSCEIDLSRKVSRKGEKPEKR